MSFSSDNPLVSNQVSDFELPNTYEEFTPQFEVEYRRMVDAVNSKEGALYYPIELATFQRYSDFSDPQNTLNVYRRVVDYGTLPNTTSKSVSHGVTFDANTKLTRAYGAATDPTAVEFIPLPFASPTLADNVSLEVDATDVTITTGSDRSSFTHTTVVLEYTK